APSLAVSGDNLFRFLPDDTNQAEAVANLMWEDGIRAVIPIWRGDVWGDGLSQPTKDNFEVLGGVILDGVRYSPATEDFSTDIESLSIKVDQAAAQYGVDAVAVHLMAFEEVVSIFTEAQNYNGLSSVKWYGSDGTALSRGLSTDGEAAQFAIKTGYPNPILGEALADISSLLPETLERIGLEHLIY
ncbi:hypothetical protein ACFLTS_05435, partial [Chloroflexota bacterium]